MFLSKGIAASALTAVALSACVSSTTPPVLPECTAASVVVYGAEELLWIDTICPVD